MPWAGRAKLYSRGDISGYNEAGRKQRSDRGDRISKLKSVLKKKKEKVKQEMLDLPILLAHKKVMPLHKVILLL